jgi:hypothetical protein
MAMQRNPNVRAVPYSCGMTGDRGGSGWSMPAATNGSSADPPFVTGLPGGALLVLDNAKTVQGIWNGARRSRAKLVIHFDV